MENFRDAELKKWLAEEYEKEPEEMEKILFPDGVIPDDGETEEEAKAAYQRLVEKLKADGVYKEDETAVSYTHLAFSAGSMSVRCLPVPDPESREIPHPHKVLLMESLHLRFYKICNLPLFCPPCLQNYFIYILILSYFLEFFNTVLVDI